MKPRALLAVAVIAASAYGGGGEYFSIQQHSRENHFLDLLVGLSLMAAGIVTWLRKPDSRVGLLLSIGGVAWFFGNYANSGVPWLFSFGHAFSGISVVRIVHAILSYSSCPLAARLERA